MRFTKLMKMLGVLLVVTGVAVAIVVSYRNSEKANSKLVFSSNTMLSALYNDYKKEYWEADVGRTIDKERANITTSEGQSYTMLRAVWTSDQQTFDKTWAWTKEQLQRPEDNLFAWKWGLKPDGTYGVLSDEGGMNTASDGDVDIAFALLLAAGRWQEEKYLDEAQKIIPNIWDQEVIEIDGTPYIASNDLEKQSVNDAVMNPSYFAPYAYREFAKVDKSHDWNKLVDGSYLLLNKSIDDKLGAASSAGLPPDWFLMNQENGVLRATESSTPDLTTNYSFDAMRTPWRLALDYEWNKEPRAKETLEKMSFLQREWDRSSVLYSTYAHDGKVVKKDEVAAIYGGNLGYFAVLNRSDGQEIYDKKLKTLYDPDQNAWVDGVSYYSDNWAWFGMALYDRQLENTAKNLQVKES